MYRGIKRIVDFILSLLGLVLLSPVWLILVLAIKLDSRGPVLFRQKRVGIHKSHFHILKFRTMRTDTPKDMPTHLLKDPEQYITRVGKFLRKTSLDELPQIVNILKGDMAVVGPRPALWNQYDLIAERDKYGANDVRPGLTGWAQINGRDELEIPVKARLDGEYVKKMGPVMDLRCFFGTFLSVLRGDGVVEGGTGSMKGGKGTGDKETGNKEIGNKGTGDKETGNKETGNKRTGNKRTGNKETGNKEIGNKGTGDKETGNKETGNKEIGNKGTGDKEIGNKETGNKETGNKETGNKRTGNKETENKAGE